MDSLLDAAGPFLNYETLLVGLLSCAVFLLVVGVASLAQGADAISRRLTTLAAFGRRGGQNTRVSLRIDDKGPNFLKFFEAFEDKILPTKQEELSALRRRLFRAGYRHPKASLMYFATRAVTAVACLLLGMLGLPLTGVRLPANSIVLFSVMASGIGFYLPVFWVSHRIGFRQQRIRAALPDAIDMLLVCVEAGLSLGAALERVSHEIRLAHPVLAQELTDVSLNIQAGKSREEALRDMAERMGLDEVRSLVAMIIQTEVLGTSIAQGLRVHAEDMRRKRFLRAEEQANKLPVKMTIPLGLFIMPTLMIVVLAPVIIRIVRILLPMGAH